ncbi:hypothetical protein FFZ99_16920 [Leptospira interrogans]|uniref:Uncharacterized protein n=2 Tax=Leptospira interrogans TaxID=173 RepID=A0A0E2D2D0_LEPIR|nr:hypothetical protein [Leptospira interrogans]ASV05280.1 hypothetical protein B2G47_03330 [Leptospira interrogans serovar Canicola]EJO79151.1 hypothetical protein LEP1GSC045_0226 [Leptospira interrogans serovar Pomona str. Kennewicki LC82-25]EKN98543.1 hypothetical protein LEP1GSC014_4066 [Leptospira interrogans serovar Pomona str. Pomona]EKO69413.1 hypothetical protein LEP1GSC069_2994 [Leptospira interrogans serovar Canicola str. Fiocruz LV133]EKR25109.1 hypothetical protein LEP1GSC087_0933
MGTTVFRKNSPNFALHRISHESKNCPTFYKGIQIIADDSFIVKRRVPTFLWRESIKRYIL